MKIIFILSRALNVTLLLGAFLGPWLPTCFFCSSYGPPESGLLFVHGFLEQLVDSIEFPWSIFNLFLLSGVVRIWFYSLKNIIMLVFSTEWRSGRPILLAGSLVANLITALLIGSWLVLFLWGYWLMWVGLISSTVLETVVLTADQADRFPAAQLEEARWRRRVAESRKPNQRRMMRKRGQQRNCQADRREKGSGCIIGCAENRNPSHC
jgi:hypothetical protein